MDKHEILGFAEHFLQNETGNYFAEEGLTANETTGIRLYDAPLLRVGAADDGFFERLKRDEAVGEEFRLPTEWLPGAKSVISLFLPISGDIRKENAKDMDWPSPGWLYARYEGQDMIKRLTGLLVDRLASAGHAALAPCIDPAIYSRTWQPDPEIPYMRAVSNWSERHVAYVCGMGTFGLSKGLITEKGVAGRLTSVITNLPLPVDERPYEEIYEYCSLCRACSRNCPAGAISVEEGKDHLKCSRFLNHTQEVCAPRYGCGKCQVKVPCESKPPKHPNIL